MLAPQYQMVSQNALRAMLRRKARISLRSGNHFGASTVRTFATACQFARPPVRIRLVSQPSGTFTSRLPTARSPSPPLDMTTAVAGPLCLRDSHPLERQLASLHDISGFQTTHPVPLPRSKTPAGPTHPGQYRIASMLPLLSREQRLQRVTNI